MIATYPPIPTRSLLPPLPSQEQSRAKAEIKPTISATHYSERLDSAVPTPSPTSEIRFRSHRIINYYKPKWKNTTSGHAATDSQQVNKDVVPPGSTTQRPSSASDSPNPTQITVTDIARSSFSPQSPITRIRPAPFDAASHLHEIITFTATAYREDELTRPSVPGPDDVTKPILRVTCVDRTRLFWSDFKITWSAAWDDQRGCKKLFRAMDRRGPVTGWRCKQAADSNGYIMQARGHRPRSPGSLVADAIRETFELVSVRMLLFHQG